MARRRRVSLALAADTAGPVTLLLPAQEAAAMSYRLPAIPYLRLRCTLRARERAVLPPYKGSLLRGAFGHALRASICTLGPGRSARAAGCAGPVSTPGSSKR